MSKSWSTVIKTCDNYWRKTCVSSGLSQEVFKEAVPAFGCCFSVAESFLKRDAYVKRRFLSRQNFTTLCSQQDMLVLVRPSANGYYIRHSKDPSPSLGLLRVGDDLDAFCSLQENVFPNGILRILWSESTPSRVLFHANNATWGEFKFDSSKLSLPPAYTQWEDTIVSHVYNEFSSCSCCCLVMTVAKSLIDNKCIQCAFIELRKEPVKVVIRCSVLEEFPLDLLEKDNLVKVRKIHLYGTGASDTLRKGGSLCKEHFVFLQAKNVIIQYKVNRLVQLERCKYELNTVNTIFVTYPEGSSLVEVHGSFALSQDKKLLGLLTSCAYKDVTFHTWNVETRSYKRRMLDVKSSSIQELNFFAVGSIYSVMELVMYDRVKLAKHIMVLHTDSGTVMVRDQMPSIVHCGCIEGWMSSLRTLDELKLYKLIALDRSDGLHHTIEGSEEPE